MVHFHITMMYYVMTNVPCLESHLLYLDGDIDFDCLHDDSEVLTGDLDLPYSHDDSKVLTGDLDLS